MTLDSEFHSGKSQHVAAGTISRQFCCLNILVEAVAIYVFFELAENMEITWLRLNCML